ncbi:MAG: GP88 family protein, partial [Saprospiraceae bacterium]
MPCLSWSLVARDTCPGAIKDRELVPACQGCYATQGNYRFPNVKAPRVHNKDDWKREDWVSDMVQALDNSRYFRWFDSGDLYSVKLAEKIKLVIEQTPWVNHWLPTRSYKFKKFSKVLNDIQALPNAVVRYSSDSVTGETIPGETTSTIVPTPEHAKKSMTLCKAYENDGKCGTCRQ